MSRPKVFRRAIGRSALLDAPIGEPRFTYKLEERWYDSFFETYQAATNAEELYLDLLPALTEAGVSIPPNLSDWLRTLHPKTGVFDGIAHWARLERAHRLSSEAARQGKYHAGPGITYPARQSMPAPLRERLGIPPPRT